MTRNPRFLNHASRARSAVLSRCCPPSTSTTKRGSKQAKSTMNCPRGTWRRNRAPSCCRRRWNQSVLSAWVLSLRSFFAFDWKERLVFMLLLTRFTLGKLDTEACDWHPPPRPSPTLRGGRGKTAAARARGEAGLLSPRELAPVEGEARAGLLPPRSRLNETGRIEEGGCLPRWTRARQRVHHQKMIDTAPHESARRDRIFRILL